MDEIIFKNIQTIRFSLNSVYFYILVKLNNDSLMKKNEIKPLIISALF